MTTLGILEILDLTTFNRVLIESRDAARDGRSWAGLGLSEIEPGEIDKLCNKQL